ncbi:MAG TPA: hypothetical protein VJO13_09135 [Ktedonobacterales bacterium]|nr:hypothetical protein [Ktedonobacterales bacterium]
MHWETWFAGGYRGGQSWTRYLPDDVVLKVCLQCNATLNARDAVELARDHAMVRFQILLSLGMLFGGFLAIVALPFLLGHFVCH